MQQSCNCYRTYMDNEKKGSCTETLKNYALYLHFFIPHLHLFSLVCLCQHLIPVFALISLVAHILPSSWPFTCCSLLAFLPGESACKHIFRIPLCNLVGRSIERPLKSPLVNKLLTTPAPAMVPPTPLISATHSLSLSRMEIKEIASRTRKELLGERANSLQFRSNLVWAQSY